MAELVDAVFRNLERMLRWVYPGIVILVLMGAARPREFQAIATIEHPWGLVVFGLATGVIAYLIQAQVVGQSLSLIGQMTRWNVNYGMHVPLEARDSVQSRGLRKALVAVFDRQAIAIEVRRTDSVSSAHLRAYLDYSWGIYHAMSMTGLAILLFYTVKDPDSAMASMGLWSVAIAGVLLAGSLYWFAVLSRIKY